MYFSGDNNLSQILKTQLSALERIGASDQINLLVQFDGSKDRDSMRIKIGQGQTVIHQQGLEYDMGSEQTLAEFVSWGMKHYPAKKYALVINGHGRGILNLPLNDGGGALSMASSPDSSSNSVLNEEKMVQALLPILAGNKIDLLIYSACLMGNLETLLTISPIAQYVIASEHLIYLEPDYREDTSVGEGISLKRMLQLLNDSPQLSAQQVGNALIDFYTDSYQYFEIFDLPGMSHYEEASLILYDLNYAAEVKHLLQNIINEIQQQIKRKKYNIELLYHKIVNTPKVHDLGYVDFGNLLRIFDEIMPSANTSSLLEMLYSQNTLIRNKTILNLPEGMLGASIFFPTERPTYCLDNFNFLIESYRHFQIDQDIKLSNIIEKYLDYVDKNRIRILEKMILELLATNNAENLNDHLLFTKMEVYLLKKSKIKIWLYWQKIKKSSYSSLYFSKHLEAIAKMLKSK